MKAGQKVIATENFGGWFGSKVERGTKGTVMEVETILGFWPMYRVKFEKTPGVVSCSRKEISRQW